MAGEGTRESANEGTPLVLGFTDKAGEKPHSATRFLLPFRLKCGPRTTAGASPHEQNPAGALVYRPVTSTDWLGENMDVRGNYLTAETRQVLFSRASWWVMSGAPEKLTMTAPDARPIEATVCPPGIVLFEDVGGEDLLRCGFLVVEVRVGTEWRLDDLLLFNELFRYWREPYAGQVKEFEKQSSGFTAPFAKLPQVAVNDVYTARWLAMLKVPLADGRNLLADDAPDPEAVFGWYADHRAFVWTRALLAKEQLNRIVPRQPPAGSLAEAGPASGFREMFGYWVKLLNADRPKLDYANGIPSGYQAWGITNQTTRFERVGRQTHLSTLGGRRLFLRFQQFLRRHAVEGTSAPSPDLAALVSNVFRSRAAPALHSRHFVWLQSQVNGNLRKDAGPRHYGGTIARDPMASGLPQASPGVHLLRESISIPATLESATSHRNVYLCPTGDGHRCVVRGDFQGN